MIPSDFPNGYDGTVLFSQRPQPEVDNTAVFANFQVIRLGDGGVAHLMKHGSAEHAKFTRAGNLDDTTIHELVNVLQRRGVLCRHLLESRRGETRIRMET